MKLQQVSDNCFAVLNERNRVCDANSGLINLGGGVVIDTQSDLPHARRMIELFSKVWPRMPKRVVNTHEDGDHVWGNQLFKGAEIIAHRTVLERMPHVADPSETQKLLAGADRFLSRLLLKAIHPGALAIAKQLQQDYDFSGINLVLPTTVFDERHVLDLDGTEVQLIYVGPCHQVGDTIVYLPKERVLFAGEKDDPGTVAAPGASSPLFIFLRDAADAMPTMRPRETALGFLAYAGLAVALIALMFAVSHVPAAEAALSVFMD